ncbi:MAG: pyridoxamine 5'-phosphate oxidase [Planctomycetota bacterium]|jgi:pyridoxamine 5'-phosphate oxidase
MQIRELLGIVGGGPQLPDPLPVDPLPIVRAWLDEAAAAKAAPNPGAMVLATVDPDGRPAARVMLCKGLDVERGAVVFYTNYESTKARDLEARPHATVVFHWDHVARQARLGGHVERLAPEESDAYYATRPLLAKLGAWASRQSEPLDDRRDLIRQARDIARRFGVGITDLLREKDVAIPRPPHWGGYRLWVERAELWCGQPGRLHDRAVWTRPVSAAAGGIVAGPWEDGARTRLQP